MAIIETISTPEFNIDKFPGQKVWQEYLEHNNVSMAAFEKYCNVVEFQDFFESGTSYFRLGMGFKNDLGGYEILTEHKNKIIPKVASTKKAPTSFLQKSISFGNEEVCCCVFDSFISFLRKVGIKDLKMNVFVLNGLLLHNSVNFKYYDKIYYYTSKTEEQISKVTTQMKELYSSIELIIATDK